MANERGISVVDPEVKLDVKLEVKSENKSAVDIVNPIVNIVKPQANSEVNKDDAYESIHSRSPVFFDLFERKSELKHQTHYCPGCGHGVVHKLIAEALEELGCRTRRSS
jgi:hypothetical protein